MAIKGKVKRKFKQDIDEHTEAALECVEQGQLGEAVGWIDELVLLGNVWEREYKKPATTITIKSMASGEEVLADRSEVRMLAEERLKYINRKLSEIQKALKKKGFHFAV